MPVCLRALRFSHHFNGFKMLGRVLVSYLMRESQAHFVVPAAPA